ncbi:Homeobox protein Hox-D13 [Entomophthora muscae]|uniref:Homeobox protein Hox-D13 n=1 Tax=Entomophthora muscae TaxID=34485 RepID=A0ACC2SA95_9FUNG|nr:Homeobox protein Hox-D13 [Entomophthora muscae]
MSKRSFANEMVLEFPALKVIEFNPKYKLRYTKSQTDVLEKFYVSKTNPSLNEKIILAESTHLTSRQVCVWFQNRRAKDRRAALPSKPL